MFIVYVSGEIMLPPTRTGKWGESKAGIEYQEVCDAKI